MRTRREFLVSAGASSALLLPPASTPTHSSSSDAGSMQILLSEGWLFCYVGDREDLMPPDATAGWQPVSVPHTWQSLQGGAHGRGVGWYQQQIEWNTAWEGKRVAVEFEAATHSAHVFLNGTKIGEHLGKAYTAFVCDLTHAIKKGKNTLLVQVDNRPSETMLPRKESFDWTSDGGLIRPVTLHVTPLVYIERISVRSALDLEKKHADVKVAGVVRNGSNKPQRFSLEVMVRPDGLSGPTFTGGTLTWISIEKDEEKTVDLEIISIDSPRLWDFDHPNLYCLQATLRTPVEVHSLIETFGIRRFEIRGHQFFLNGEHVSLIGVERIAGSEPMVGMAEGEAWIRLNYDDMKELNCIFSRAHWPQDCRVLDYCDRHGILMQQEVPAWGSYTFKGTSEEIQSALESNGLEQLREMVRRDGNHPCIIAWGLCNEIDGKNPSSQRFVRKLKAEARELDPSRLLTYASNSLDSNPADDIAGELDYISTNEYFGSWAPGGVEQVRNHVARIRAAFPDRPIVISEYGWCECQPSILPGDANRADIIDLHTEVFRDIPEIAGTIFFDYNDYRTHMGDKGTGALRQRVHGVVDLYGKRKGSFRNLRRQASPIQSAAIQRSSAGTYQLTILTRTALPAYTLSGYSVRWSMYGYDGLPMAAEIVALRTLYPGEEATVSVTSQLHEQMRITADVCRPDGRSVLTVDYLDEAADA